MTEETIVDLPANVNGSDPSDALPCETFEAGPDHEIGAHERRHGVAS